MRLVSALLTLALLPLPAAQAQDAAVVEAEVPFALADVLAQRKHDCASFDNGTLTVQEGAFVRTDLTGEGTPDWVLDETHLLCSSAASLWCGTGGCGVNFLVDDVVTTRLAKGWEVVPFPPMTVLLVQIHGVNCGGTNLNACVEAMVWDPTEKRFYTLYRDG